MDSGSAHSERDGLLQNLSWVAALALLVGLATSALGLFIVDIGARDLATPDDRLRLIRIGELLDGSTNWFSESMPWSNAPFGTTMHWSRALDGLVILLAAPMAPIFGWHDATYWAGLLWAPLGFLAVAFSAAWCARALTDRATAWFAVLILALQPTVILAGLIGRLDHHALLLAVFLIQAGTSIRLLEGPRPILVVALGASSAVGVWVSPEAMIGSLLALATISLDWLWRGGSERARAIATFGGAWAVGLVGAGVADGGVRRVTLEQYDRLSWPFVAVALATTCAGFLIRVGAPVCGSFARRLALALGALTVAGAVVVGTGVDIPKLLWTPASLLPAELVEHWLLKLPGFTKLTDDPTLAALNLGLPVVGGLLATRLGWRQRSPRWLALAGWLVSTTVLGYTSFRLSIYAQALAAVPMAYSAVALLRRVGPGAGSLIPRAAVVCAALAGYAVPATLMPTDQGDPDARPEATSCSVGAAKPDGTDFSASDLVLSHLDLSVSLHRTLDVSVVATGHHRNVEGMLAVRDTFRGSADAARAEIVRRGVDYVIVCTDIDDPLFEPRPAESLYDALRLGNSPDWLQLVSSSDSARWYKVTAD